MKTSSPNPPLLVIIAGPNGAGKSTCASVLLPESVTFVNADEIAKALPIYPSPKADVQAGRLMLQRMEELAEQRVDFAIETTLANRSLSQRIIQYKAQGYRLHLIFLWLPSADLAVARVASRVRSGGHSVPEETVRRRYRAGLSNFFSLYRPLADEWTVFRNEQRGQPELIARGTREGLIEVALSNLWSTITEVFDHADIE